jgi:hypothetical protein
MASLAIVFLASNPDPLFLSLHLFRAMRYTAVSHWSRVNVRRSFSQVAPIPVHGAHVARKAALRFRLSRHPVVLIAMSIE